MAIIDHEIKGVERVDGAGGLAGAPSEILVPAGAHWEIIAISVGLVSSATAGNRTAFIDLLAGAGPFLRFIAGVVQAATLSRSYYAFNGAPTSAAFVGSAVAYLPLPPGLILGPGMAIRAGDVGAVDAAADTYQLTAIVNERAV